MFPKQAGIEPIGILITDADTFGNYDFFLTPWCLSFYLWLSPTAQRGWLFLVRQLLFQYRVTQPTIAPIKRIWPRAGTKGVAWYINLNGKDGTFCLHRSEWTTDEKQIKIGFIRQGHRAGKAFILKHPKSLLLIHIAWAPCLKREDFVQSSVLFMILWWYVKLDTEWHYICGRLRFHGKEYSLFVPGMKRNSVARMGRGETRAV